MGAPLLPTLQRRPRGPLQADALGWTGMPREPRPSQAPGTRVAPPTHTGAEAAIAVRGPELEAAVQARRSIQLLGEEYISYTSSSMAEESSGARQA